MSLSRMLAIRNISTLTVLFGVVLLCFIWGGLYYKVQSERQLELANATKETTSYTRALAEHTVRTLRGLDEMTLFLKYQAETNGLTVDLARLVKERRFAGQPFLVMGVLDAQGDLVASSETPFVMANSRDREFFTVHTNQDSGALFIGKPLVGRSSGKLSIQLSRRINRADGSFNGVVVVGVDPNYFADFYRQVDLGEQANISIIGRDGILRVRQSGSKVDVGLDFSQRVQTEFSRGEAGTYTATSIVDGVKRIFSYRTLQEYPLIVAVGVPEAGALAGFNQRVASYYTICGVISAVIILFIALLLAGIARHQRVETELRDSMARIQAITDSTQDAVLLMDPRGKIAYWNPAAGRIFGYTATEALGQNLHQLLTPPRYHAAHHKAFAGFLQTGGGDAIGKLHEIEALHKDGHEIPIELSLSAIRLGTGWHAVGIIRDITERKRAEKELQQLNKDLEQRVAERTAELHRLNRNLYRLKEAAEVANQAKSNFLANVSHELRTPLNGILGMSYIMAGTPLNSEQQECLKIIQDAGQRLLALINNVLDFSQLEDKELLLELKPFRLQDELEQAVARLETQAAANGLALTLEVDADVPAVIQGDAARLSQVLGILLSNAVKFTETGTIDVRVVRLNPADAGISLQFSVQDSGIGMTEEEQKTVFQTFSQVDASTTRRYGGTGLGLALAERLVSLMGGEIWLESQPGRGSTFYFTALFGHVEAATTASVSSAPDESGQPAAQVLARLRQCLADYDAEALEVLAEVRRRDLLAVSPEVLEQLTQRVEAFDFAAAQALLAEKGDV